MGLKGINKQTTAKLQHRPYKSAKFRSFFFFFFAQNEDFWKHVFNDSFLGQTFLSICIIFHSSR